MATVTITLPDQLAADVARAGLLHPEKTEAIFRGELIAHAALQHAIRAGDESGPTIPAAEVFAEIRTAIREQSARQA